MAGLACKEIISLTTQAIKPYVVRQADQVRSRQLGIANTRY